ncbi:hypothetical protein ACWDYH_15365 [Nocardia goodfellowii]
MAEQSPLAKLIAEGRDGQLTVRMDPEEFAKVDRECTTFQTVIRDLQTAMNEISGISTWGFGDHQGSNLTSAQVIASRFRAKSQGGENNFNSILEEHWLVVEDIRLLHAAIRDRFMAEDESFAARFHAEVENLERLSDPSGQPGVTGPIPEGK